MSDTVVVRVPASTSNCGPGFDTLGLALGLYGEVTVNRTVGEGVSYSGRKADFPSVAVEMIEEVAESFWEKTSSSKFGISFDIVSDAPIARGLGSSVILRGGVLHGINHLAGNPLSKDDEVELISRIEGHPDNASATILGGFTVARFCPDSNRYLGTQKFPVSDSIAFVVVSPDLEIKTEESRGSLPSEIEFAKVVSSLNSLAYLVGAFASGDYERLSACQVDHIHEPYRLPHIPKGKEAVLAGINAGALTGWLSGSGSSVLCVAKKENAESVLAEMKSEFTSAKIGYQSFVLRADNDGVTVLI